MLSLTAEATPKDILIPVLLVAGVVGFGVILTISIRGKIARRNRERPTGRQLIEQVKAGRRQQDAHGVELVELARRLSAQLDNKAARLEALVRQADERIEVLRRSAGGDGPPGSVADPLEAAADGTAPHEAASPAPPPPDPLTRAVYEHADAGLTPLEIAQTLDEQVGKVELILALREPAIRGS